MLLKEGDYLEHYGILRKSGRYPWGSGATPNQRSQSFLDIIDDLKKQGMSESQIAKSFHTDDYPFTVADLRATKSRATTILKQEQVRTATRLKEKGMGNSAIGRQMGVNESTVRSLLEPGRLEKLDILQTTAEMLKQQVEEKGFIDVGANVERDLPIGDNPETRIGISRDKFQTALSMLKEEGYPVHPVHTRQVGTGEMTRNLVLCKPGTTKQEAFVNRDKIQLITKKSDDGGRNFNHDLSFSPPLNISSKRVAVRYKEDGGADADGVIFVRPGVKDVSLGKSNYAQVRIAIDDSHFLKGMAVYKDDLPVGVDLMFNTNKSNTGNKLDAMKPLETLPDGSINRDNPFGAFPKLGGQIKDKHGNVTSAMNKLNEEGDWNTWSKTLSSQVLSKQAPSLAKTQLDLTYSNRREEFETIKSLTNPLVRRKLLETFADETDSAAVHLKAAHMRRQATKVILPSNHVKPTEIFAPTFRDGERVALIRYPHAGTFEIPELTVNNRGREVRKMFQGTRDVPDAVAIHPKVAERLSGADFDGDAVVVIPNNRGDIKSTHALDQLKGFDPQTYKVPLGPKTKKYPKGTPTIDSTRKGHVMGDVTNLISDMTIKGASFPEIAQAVRHSMVVIDSEKHNLDYKASARDHGIIALKKRYQGVNAKGQVKGASTLITRATSELHVPKRKDAPAGPGVTRASTGTIDNKTGKKVYVETGDLKPDGKIATFRSKKLAETDDARTLLSEHGGTAIEKVYAEHSNRLKAMANEARLEYVRTVPTPYSKSAKKVYSKEVESLNAKLNIALLNSPLERQAQIVANKIVAQQRRANPDMDGSDIKKIKGQALTEARLRTGAGKERIPITPREWDAIQAGAISKSKLEKILNNSDIETIREHATPRKNAVMTDLVTARAKSMLAGGATPSEVADALGIALSTLQSGLAEGG